jgi:MarR family transcriptional regulator, organic hydroperoxide resistance regulator
MAKSRVPRQKPLGEVLSFMRLLWAVTQGVESTSKRMLAQIGVTGPQRMVIRIVGHFGPIHPAELAHILHVDPSSLSGVLARLENAGFLKRRRDPADGRRAFLTLSSAGKRLNAQREGTVEAAVERALARAGKARLSATEGVLKALADELSAQSGHGGKSPSWKNSLS